MKTTYRAVPCGCGHPICKSWHVDPVAAVQCVSFTEQQAIAVATLLNQMEEPPKVIVAVLTTENDVSVEVYATGEAAEAARQRNALENWGNHDFNDRPADPVEMADTFFELMGERRGWSFVTYEREVCVHGA